MDSVIYSPQSSNIRFGWTWNVMPGSKTVVSPAGIAVLSDLGNDTLYVSDLFGDIKSVDGLTGKITKVPTGLFQPAHVAVTPDQLAVVSEVFGTVQQIGRAHV